MDYSNFIVLLARQRSGTHPIRSVLDSNSALCCLDEIFWLQDARSRGTGETNFFTFFKQHAKDDPLKMIPVDHEGLFLEYLQYLRQLITKPFILMDVKYNSTHHITRNYQPLGGPPYLLELILKHGLRTFVLTRKNHLRYFVSLVKARESNKFVLNATEPDAQDRPVRLCIPELLLEMNRCAQEDRIISDCFGTYATTLGYDYRDKFFTCDYAEAFPAGATSISPDFLARFSTWLGIPVEYGQQCGFKKQSSLPLQKTIENFEEVAAALRGTTFESFLQDEPAYFPTPSL